MLKKFDDFIMIDWSANNSPKSGKDSIWLASSFTKPMNYRTRQTCAYALESMLIDALKNNKRILCCFDFCFGLPKGSVAIMREAAKDTSKQAHWEWLWQYLSENIKDDDRNKSNRFQVASEMNRLLSGKKAPFWGYPYNAKEKKPNYLESTKDKKITGEIFAEFRSTESAGMKSIWQLLGAGSVGSQSLLGMAYLQMFRNSEKFKNHIRVYPFENCDEASIIFAETYYDPNIFLLDEAITPKDKAQVISAVEYCQEAQTSGKLKTLLSPIDNPDITQDEGWVFTEPKHKP